MNLQPLLSDTQKFLASAPIKIIIGGERISSASGKTFTAHNPSDGSPLAEIYAAGIEEVELAVQAARKAMEGPWPKMSPSERER